MVLLFYLVLSLTKAIYVLPINFYNNELAASLISTELLTENNLELYLKNDELKNELNSKLLFTRSNPIGIAKLFYSIVLDELNEEFYDRNVQFRLQMKEDDIELNELCDNYTAVAEIVAMLATEQNPYKRIQSGNSIFVFNCGQLQIDKANEMKTSAVNQCENVGAIAFKNIVQAKAAIKKAIINMITQRNDNDDNDNFEMALDSYLNRCIMQRTTPIGKLNRFKDEIKNVTSIVNSFFG